MSYKIWDETVLDSTKGTMDLSFEIPKEMYEPDNADGTRPEVKVSIEAPTLRALVGTFQQVTEDDIATVALGWADEFVPEEVMDRENPEEFMLWSEGFNEHEVFEADSALGKVAVKVNAPHAAAVMFGLAQVSRDQTLSGLVTSFMPDDNEDEW